MLHRLRTIEVNFLFVFLAILITFIASMSPLGELRLSIPLGMAYHLPLVVNLAVSLAGNAVPAFAIIYLFEPVAAWFTKRSSLIDRCYVWVLSHTRRRFTARFASYSAAIALVLFVGTPLPMAGAWTGALAAVVFGIPKRISIPAVLMGNCIAAAIVTAVSLGVFHFFQ